MILREVEFKRLSKKYGLSRKDLQEKAKYCRSIKELTTKLEKASNDSADPAPAAPTIQSNVTFAAPSRTMPFASARPGMAKHAFTSKFGSFPQAGIPFEQAKPLGPQELTNTSTPTPSETPRPPTVKQPPLHNRVRPTIPPLRTESLDLGDSRDRRDTGSGRSNLSVDHSVRQSAFDDEDSDEVLPDFLPVVGTDTFTRAKRFNRRPTPSELLSGSRSPSGLPMIVESHQDEESSDIGSISASEELSGLASPAKAQTEVVAPPSHIQFDSLLSAQSSSDTDTGSGDGDPNKHTLRSMARIDTDPETLLMVNQSSPPGTRGRGGGRGHNMHGLGVGSLRLNGPPEHQHQHQEHGHDDDSPEETEETSGGSIRILSESGGHSIRSHHSQRPRPIDTGQRLHPVHEDARSVHSHHGHSLHGHAHSTHGTGTRDLIGYRADQRSPASEAQSLNPALLEQLTTLLTNKEERERESHASPGDSSYPKLAEDIAYLKAQSKKHDEALKALTDTIGRSEAALLSISTGLTGLTERMTLFMGSLDPAQSDLVLTCPQLDGEEGGTVRAGTVVQMQVRYVLRNRVGSSAEISSSEASAIVKATQLTLRTSSGLRQLRLERTKDDHHSSSSSKPKEQIDLTAGCAITLGDSGEHIFDTRWAGHTSQLQITVPESLPVLFSNGLAHANLQLLRGRKQVRRISGEDGWRSAVSEVEIRRGIVETSFSIGRVKKGAMIGVMRAPDEGKASTKSLRSLLEWSHTNAEAYSFYSKGKIVHANKAGNYGRAWGSGDTITVRMDAREGVISFSVNGEDMGVAFKGVDCSGHVFFPHAEMWSKGDSLQIVSSVQLGL
eukprot:gnl/Dysnectes_brevis/1066_a1187_1841.p1 GENE.gnl/Dysnectes_brevis/1066_a1187_1841~~gnl/Dysnectes_brevis/1066_a1187_1841.p1  ORF type:complete len:838 (-),score=161.15 gnl/Dysnectes_brevis/1066_a1187_1841:182-2695(-)